MKGTGMMQRMTIFLPTDKAEQLVRYAIAERRDPRDQAAIFIEYELKMLGQGDKARQPVGDIKPK